MRPIIGITADLDESRLKLKRQYAESVESAGGCPIVLAPSGEAGNPAVKIDGLLVSGGDDLHPSYYNEETDYELKLADSCRTDFELALIREIIRLRKPLLGICYGMQLINVAFGGSLYQDIKSQIPVAIEHKKDYHFIRISDNKILRSGEFNVNTSHHQAVKTLGKDLKIIALSADNVIEAFCMEDYPFLLGVQWHPERLKDELSEKIFRSFVEASLGRK